MNGATDWHKQSSELQLLSLEKAAREGTDAPIQQDAEKLSGQPTIGARRVPVETLINYLAAGQTIQDFLSDYDAVTEQEVLAVLGVIRQAVREGRLTGIHLRDENSF